MAQVFDHAGGSDVARVTITKGDRRPWIEKWVFVTAALEDVREVYSGSVNYIGSARMEHRVMSFFIECDHVRDWLNDDIEDDDVEDLPVTTDDVAAHADKWPLDFCSAICNTHKHHSRKRKNEITARVRELGDAPDGKPRLTIEVEWAEKTRKHVDALELAEACVQSWRDFFKEHGIDVPPP